MNILFYLVKDKVTQKGLMPVYCLLTVNGVQKRFSLGYSCNPKHWNAPKQRAKDLCPDSELINLQISRLSEKFNAIKIKAGLEQKQLTVIEVRELLQENHSRLMFLGLFDTFVKLQERRKNVGEITDSTLENWTFRRVKLQEWISSKGIDDILVSRIEKADFERMKLFFLEKGLANNYISKVLDDFRRVLQYAVNENVLLKNPFAGLSIPEQHKEPEFLTEIELKKLIDEDFSHNGFYDRVRDYFVFTCYTGLHWADYKKLVKGLTKIEPGIDGRLWIMGNRKKGDNRGYGKLSFPLLKGARLILEKYGSADKLPLMENQTFNRILKEIQRVMEFKTVMCCSLARDTFAHHALNTWNVNEKTVAKMLGHEGTDMLKRYARTSEKKIADDTRHLE
jgi:site-specific recombinase XerD